MRVIIPGGVGLIGKQLAKSLAIDGYEVIILSRDPDKARAKSINGVQVVRWDGKTADGWGHLVDGAHAIVNLAGENLAAGRWTDSMKKKILDSRVNPGSAIVTAVQAATHKPAVLIQSSAVGIYGPSDTQIFDESASPADDFMARVCIAWEKSSAGVETLGVRRALIRSGVVLSLEGGSFPRILLPHRFFVGGPLGNGKQWFPWIHIDDEVAAIRFLMDNPTAAGPFNLASPTFLNNRQFEAAIGKVMKRPAIMPAPAFAIRLVFGEMATVVLDGQRVMPKRLLELGFKFRFADPEYALKDIL